MDHTDQRRARRAARALKAWRPAPEPTTPPPSGWNYSATRCDQLGCLNLTTATLAYCADHYGRPATR